ncbi:hypothetical protein MSAN_00631900 [Mycena sanguinolenta]|uniref:Uncharacterized protein n=1 Tax=Mycena sanguinolenta TaxID=230812 RepID=A0A8H6Z2Z7_9AGAR|nr:hypothetical protein MSAN_00631900 [Mycena sanguinolenta]
MDSVPTSQSFQDGTDESFNLACPKNTITGFGQPVDTLYDDDWDQLLSVPSSQPFEDGEDIYMTSTPCTLNPPRILTNIEPSNSLKGSLFAGWAGDESGRMEMSAEMRARRARLVRRAPPVKPDSKPILASNTPRRFNLVRRVTKGPSQKFLKALELEKKQDNARHAARRISRKIQVLTKATARLHREHRRLRAFMAAHKENMFGIE